LGSQLAIEPKTFRETNIVLEGLEARLNLIQKMTWGVIGLLGALITGAAALYFQLGDIRTDVAVLKANLGSLKEQQSAIQESLRSIDTRTQASLSRIENKLASNQTPAPLQGPDESPLKLADEEIALLRAVLKTVKFDKPQEAKIGNFVSDQATLAVMPRAIIDKIPRLASYSFTYDPSGSLLIVSNRTGRVAAIIEPA
jgi:hypothetical protein